MVKRLLLFLSLFVSFTCLAQVETDSSVAQTDTIIPDTFNFDLKLFKGKGKLTFISHKSKSTGGTYLINLPTGEWQYFDDNEVMRVKGSYKVKGDQAYLTGFWEYYDEEGELLMSKEEPRGKSPPVYYKPFVILTEEGYDVVNYNKNGVLEMITVVLPKIAKETEEGYLVYDTLIAMDNRNPDTWLVPAKRVLPVKEALNLVPNPSFEKNDGKVQNRAEVRKQITGWQRSAGTPDYYRLRKLNTVEGMAMIGCRFYTETFHDIEFISAELNEQLEKDKVYCFRVYLRLRESSIYGVNAFGVLFSPEVPTEGDLIYGAAKPSVKHNGGAGLTYKTKWMELSCTYKASGDEQYITLGSFANADSMNKTKLKGENFEAYYYFDMVQLFALEKEADCPCSMGSNDAPEIPEKEEPVITEEPKTFIIRNVFFDNDKWELLPESYDALDSLFDVIDENGFKKIEISGHTSNTGSRERNLLLSKNRAQAVKKYLVKKGLSASMFECKGYGPDRPIADNETEEGQAENRRVEFTILE